MEGAQGWRKVVDERKDIAETERRRNEDESKEAAEQEGRSGREGGDVETPKQQKKESEGVFHPLTCSS